MLPRQVPRLANKPVRGEEARPSAQAWNPGVCKSGRRLQSRRQVLRAQTLTNPGRGRKEEKAPEAIGDAARDRGEQGRESHAGARRAEKGKKGRRSKGPGQGEEGEKQKQRDEEGESEGESPAAGEGGRQKGRGGGECAKPGGEGRAPRESPILQAKRY